MCKRKPNPRDYRGGLLYNETAEQIGGVFVLLRTGRVCTETGRSSFGPVMTVGTLFRTFVLFSVGRRIVILFFTRSASAFMRAVFLAVFWKPFYGKFRYYELFFGSFGFRFRGLFPASRHADNHQESKT